MAGTKNKMSDLRDHLFATIEALRDEEKPMDIARAKAVAEVAGTLIESAKVELQFVEALGRDAADSEFFDQVNLPVRERKPRLIGGGR